MAISRKFLRRPFERMAAKHMVEGRTAARSDQDGVDIELLGRMGDGFGGVVRHGPDRDYFDLSFSNSLKSGFECFDSCFRNRRGEGNPQ